MRGEYKFYDEDLSTQRHRGRREHLRALSVTQACGMPLETPATPQRVQKEAERADSVGWATLYQPNLGIKKSVPSIFSVFLCVTVLSGLPVLKTQTTLPTQPHDNNMTIQNDILRQVSARARLIGRTCGSNQVSINTAAHASIQARSCPC